jgi:hypothetical protein
MKTTRLILALAAALSLGLAVFANIRTNATQSTVKASDEIATATVDVTAAVSGTPVAEDGCLNETNQAAASGTQVAVLISGAPVAEDGCLNETNQAATSGTQVAVLQVEAKQTAKV